jgi:uncharacterized protein YbcI
MAMKTRGQMESDITETLVRFEKDFMGRGPTEARTYLVEDMVIIKLLGVITRAEQQLASTGDKDRGRDLIKQTRMALIEKARPILETAIQAITRETVKSMHTDISTKTGERIIVFTLENPPKTL